MWGWNKMENANEQRQIDDRMYMIIYGASLDNLEIIYADYDVKNYLKLYENAFIEIYEPI